MKKDEEQINIICKQEQSLWFAMRATYRRELDAQNYLANHGIESFIPMHYKEFIKSKQKKRELVPIIRSLIFVHTTPEKIQAIKQHIPYLQYITDTRSGQKVIVPEDQMKQFIAVCGTYNDQLLYFNPDELNLTKGTRVRICGGEFEGKEGVFIKVKGARDKRVVIAVQGIIAVAMATIHPDLIQPIN